MAFLLSQDDCVFNCFPVANVSENRIAKSLFKNFVMVFAKYSNIGISCKACAIYIPQLLHIYMLKIIDKNLELQGFYLCETKTTWHTCYLCVLSTFLALKSAAITIHNVYLHT